MAGNFRSGRHAKQYTAGPHSQPVKPLRLRADASQFWDESIATAKHLGESDTSLCVLAADLYTLLQDSLELAKDNPIDKEIRIAATSYAERFARVVGQLGIDPLGRHRMKPDKSGRDEDPLAEFGVVG